MSDSKFHPITSLFDLPSLHLEMKDIAETLEGAFFDGDIRATKEKPTNPILDLIARLHRTTALLGILEECIRTETRKPFPVYTVTIEKADSTKGE